MVNPFLVEFGRQFADATYANDEASNQLVVYASHLQQPNGLMRHAYDEARVQSWADPVTGRWFQVVDKGSRADNWTETSCSAMYTFTIARAVERGYVDPGLRAVASYGYQGVLARVSLGGDGRTNMIEISIGTNAGDYSYYINRTRATNDFHGLGAFIITNEQLLRTGG